MADYKEAIVEGKKWRRCNSIHVDNPVAPGVPYLSFQEQDVIEIDGKVTQVGMDNCSIMFNPANMVELVDPDTLEPTGDSVPEGYVYLVLFSKYLATAKARDVQREEMLSAYNAAQTPPVTPEPTPSPTPEPTPTP